MIKKKLWCMLWKIKRIGVSSETKGILKSNDEINSLDYWKTTAKWKHDEFLMRQIEDCGCGVDHWKQWQVSNFRHLIENKGDKY